MKIFPIMLERGYGRSLTSERQVREANSCVCVVGLPWDMIADHEKQAQNNHSQTLARLAERGGLSASEAVAVLEDRGYWHPALKDGEAHVRLYELLRKREEMTERDIVS